MEAKQQIDLLTVISVAVIAYAGLNVAHEIVGHCGMALVMGTKCTILSSTNIPLATFPPTWKYNIIVAAGSTANFALGLVCLGLLRRAQTHRLPQAVMTSTGPPLTQVVLTSRARPLPRAVLTYFLWLLMAVNLLLASTYIAVAPIIKFGDSYILIQNLPGQMFWRPAVALAGAIAWWFSFRLCRIELARLVGIEGREARAIAWRLVLPAYLTGGVLTVTSALFSQLDQKIAQLEAAGGTFGLTIWLLLLPFFLPQIQTADREPLIIPRRIGWIVVGALTAVIFIGVLGRGIAL
ncbi:MAG TPA: hypothetical protein VJT71_06260 [Pyrinomonadaceae bacterium]|nr:hypothetical protein [Pyrinomonadaceae bacterium]